MYSILKVLVLAVFLAVAVYSEAQDEPSSATSVTKEVASEPEQKPKPNKRVCRRVNIVGSHIPKRVCMKQRQWEDLTREAQTAVQDGRI